MMSFNAYLFLKPIAYLLIIILAISVLAIPVLYILYRLKTTKEKRPTGKLAALWEKIYTDNVKLSWFILSLAIILLIVVGLRARKGLTFDNVLEGVFVEMFGMLFDIILLVLLFNWINAKGEKKRRIDRYMEEIKDFIEWQDDEAKYRIRGNILRLNEEGVTKFTLSELDLSYLKLPEVKFNGSSLNEVNFTNSHLHKAEFNDIHGSSLTFDTDPGISAKFKDTWLNQASFQNSHIQHSSFCGAYLNNADFSDAKLSKVDFRKAKLLNVNFLRASFYDVEFEGAQVDKDFLSKLKRWNITGKFNIDHYKIVKQPVRGYPGKFQYFLRKKI